MTLPTTPHRNRIHNSQHVSQQIHASKCFKTVDLYGNLKTCQGVRSYCIFQSRDVPKLVKLSTELMPQA